VEFAGYDSGNTTLLLAGLSWKPVGNLIVLTDPGVEWAHHKDHGSDTVLPVAETADGAEDGGGKFACRVGAGYEFHAGKISITPGVGLDFIEEHTTKIYAVSFGMGFD
jgi:hypothetical protein